MSFVCNVLERFQLHLITDEWIKSNFMSHGTDLPSQYAEFLESVDLSRLLEEASDTVKPVLMNLEEYNISWDSLVEGNVRPKALFYFLNHVVTKAVDNSFPDVAFLQGLGAAQFYFLMLAIPDANVFCVFSSDLYSKCLKLINMASVVKLSSDEQCNNYLKLLLASVRTLLLASLKALSLPLRVGNLSLNDECIDATVLTLSELTRLKPSVLDYHSSLCSTAFDILNSFCVDNHRNVQSVKYSVLQRLFPNFLLGIYRNTDLSNREVSSLQSQTVTFITRLLRVVPLNSIEPFTILIKKLCTVSSERSDNRQKICDLVIKLLRCYPISAVSEFLRFVLKLTYDESVGYRLFAIELIGCVLQDNLYESFKETVSSRNPCEPHGVRFSIEIPLHYLLYSLFSRIIDHAVTVRTRALSLLTLCLKSRNQNLKEAINDIFVIPFVSEEMPSEDTYFVFMDFRHFLKKLDSSDSIINSQCLLGGKAVVGKVIDRCLDSKVFVRRSAIQLLAKILCLGRHWLNEHNISVLTSHCRDISTSVRKSSAECLTELLLEYPNEFSICEAWVQNVFPMVEDNETAVSEKALECMEQVILKNLVEHARSKYPEDKLPWKIMNFLGRLQVRKFFSRACQVWGEKSVLKKYPLLKILRSHVGTENNVPAWGIMASMADSLSIKDSDHILEYFYNNVYKNPTADHRLSQLVVEVLAVSCSELSLDKKKKLLTDLEPEILNFELAVTVLPKCIEIMQTLSLSVASNQGESAHDSQSCISPDWAVGIAQVCEKYINGALQSPASGIANEEKFVRAVIALGESSLLAPNTVKTQTVKQLGRVIDPSSGRVIGCSSIVKAGIVVTLGKISLQCEKLAKSIIAIFGRLLSTTSDSYVKSNMIIALSDLTVRYTSLVECLLPEMCLCLKDKVRVVRENTLVLLTGLIQEDYLKIRSALLFHLLNALTDEDEVLRNITSKFFIESALVKNTHLFQNHFLECLFYFNGCLNDEHCQITVTNRERKGLSLQGKHNQKKRESIYCFMLSQMDIQQRFTSHRMIVDSICGAAVVEGWKLDKSKEDVLQDAFFCLLAKESRIIPSPGENDDEVPADGDDAAHQALHVAKAKFISEVISLDEESQKLYMSLKVVRGYVIGSEVPTIVKLHQKLSSLKSPLAKDVMKFLHFQIQEYKVDISDIFKKDPDVLKRVLADVRRYEIESATSRSDAEDRDSSLCSPSLIPEEELAGMSLQEKGSAPSTSSKSGTTLKKSPRKRSKYSDNPHDSSQPSSSSWTESSIISSEALRSEKKSPSLIPEEELARKSLREKGSAPRRFSKSETTPKKSPRKRKLKYSDNTDDSSQPSSSSWTESSIISSEALRSEKKSPSLVQEEELARKSLREKGSAPRRSSKSETTPKKSPRKRKLKYSDNPDDSSQPSSSSCTESSILFSKALRSEKKSPSLIPEEELARKSLREKGSAPRRSSKSETTPKKSPRKRKLKSSDSPLDSSQPSSSSCTESSTLSSEGPRSEKKSPSLIPEEELARMSLREEGSAPRRSSKSETTLKKSPRKRRLKSSDNPLDSSQPSSCSWTESNILSGEALRSEKKPRKKTKKRSILI